ncbi:MAG: ArdC-like ssDNA-binding domain-containing protein [Candidatus Nanopelagicales bacterium]
MPTPPKPRRRERSPEQAAAAAAAREERLEQLHQTLADGVAAIRDGQAWADWLATAAKFHRYSFGNQILIAAQNPQATMVAGYQAWAVMGRQVRKGEKALWVLAPVTRRPSQPGDDNPMDVEDLTGPTTTATGPEEATGQAGRGRGAVVGFRGVGVFDISQTDGPDLPTPPRPQLLAGQAPLGLWDALADAITARGYTVTRCASAAEVGGANGITDYTTRTVTVRADVDDAMAWKTLLHEAGHVWLHNPLDPTAEGPACRGLIEVEAESVAYLVAAHHGLDTSGYTFAYIAGWAGRDDHAVTATAGRVLSAARSLIAVTDPDTTTRDTVPDAVAARVDAGAQIAEGTAADAEASHARVAAAAGHGGGHTQRLREITAAAQVWFTAQAATSPTFAAAAIARGHTAGIAIEHGVGWAPSSWTGLVDHLCDHGYTPDELLAAGVATTTSRGRLIDRLRGRITFAIHDHAGVVGWTARDTTGRDGAPKYLNSPAGVLYDKSRLLYGTQHVTAETATVVLVEGPWDALAITTATGGAAVGLAACGTAVTDHHLRIATTGGRSLVLAPDADPAGLGSLGRTLAMLADHGAGHPTAITTPPGADLADVHAGGGAPAVRQALAAARPAGLVYAEQHLTARPPADTPEVRVAAARAAAAHSTGLTVTQRAALGAVLIRHAGIGPDTALAILTPGPVMPPKPRTPAPAPTGAAARSWVRR